jgi:hypothetical protein
MSGPQAANLFGVRVGSQYAKGSFKASKVKEA